MSRNSSSRDRYEYEAGRSDIYVRDVPMRLLQDVRPPSSRSRFNTRVDGVSHVATCFSRRELTAEVMPTDRNSRFIGRFDWLHARAHDRTIFPGARVATPITIIA